MKILEDGKLRLYAGYAGNREDKMPSKGEVFIDSRPGIAYLGSCCRNCGDYSFISVEEARVFIKFVEGEKEND